MLPKPPHVNDINNQGNRNITYFPTLLIQVQFQKVIQTAIPRDLEFWTYSQTGAGFLGEDDGADDAVAVARKVERPLVQ